MTPALKVCGQPGCAELIPANKRRCPAHGGSQRSGKPRGSTRAWRKLRLRVLHRDGHRCVKCGAPATDIHHRKRVADGGDDELRNLESHCNDCHVDEHADDQAPRVPTPSRMKGTAPVGALAVRVHAEIAQESR